MWYSVQIIIIIIIIIIIRVGSYRFHCIGHMDLSIGVLLVSRSELVEESVVEVSHHNDVYLSSSFSM